MTKDQEFGNKNYQSLPANEPKIFKKRCKEVSDNGSTNRIGTRANSVITMQTFAPTDM